MELDEHYQCGCCHDGEVVGDTGMEVYLLEMLIDWGAMYELETRSLR